jgi:methyl-accepting chemotaxis protein
MSSEKRPDGEGLGLRLRIGIGLGGGVLAAGLAAEGLFVATGSWLWATLPCVGIAALLVVWSDLRIRRDRAMLDALTRVAREVAEGGAFEIVDTASLGSMRDLGKAFNRVFDSLGQVAHRVLDVVDRVSGLPQRITEAIAEIETSSDAQEEAVEETASLMANINSSIRVINERVDNLSRTADDSVSSIHQMGSSVDEVARNTGALHQAVETSTSAVHEMGASIRQVAEGAQNVQQNAEETASSILEMDRSVQEVGEHVKQASTLTVQVSEGAREGSQAVAATIEDIKAIRELTFDSRTVLERLVSRIREIAEILNVIGDINDETNLLSLNAAIIAAQAGEQGKAFLVVANHVKTLAQRTASSTKEIERLIAAVQTESDNAVTAMSAGTDAIEKGVSRSRLAGEALERIRGSAEESSSRVSEIARATEEQTRNSKLVARAAQETSSQVQQISIAISEQSRASEQMLKSSEDALQMCRHVHRSTEEQRETGRFITERIGSITDMIRQIQESTAAHARSSESVAVTVQRLLENAQKSSHQIPEVNAMVRDLQSNAEQIISELARFEKGRTGFGD